MAQLDTVVALLFTAAERTPPLSGRVRTGGGTVVDPAGGRSSAASAATTDQVVDVWAANGRWRLSEPATGRSSGVDRSHTWTAGPAGPPLAGGRVGQLLEPSWLLFRRDLQLQPELVEVAGRPAFAATSTPRWRATDAPGAALKAAVWIDAEYGLLLRRQEYRGDALWWRAEFEQLHLPDAAAADESTYAPPPGATVRDTRAYFPPAKWKERLVSAAFCGFAAGRALIGRPLPPASFSRVDARPDSNARPAAPDR